MNPAAGDGSGEDRAAEARDLLEGHEVVERETDRVAGAGGAARDLAGDAEVLAVAGGDGTLREVVEALAGEASPPLLPVAAGRGNSTATHLYGEGGWREALRGLGPDAGTWPLDAGTLEADGWGPRLFVLGASTGLLASAVRAADRTPLLPGSAAYPLGTLWSWMAGGAEPVRVAVDGDPLHEGPARLAAAGGGELRGGDVPLFPEASLADGRLDVLVVGDVPAWRVPKLARTVRTGRHVEMREVRHARGEAVVLERREGGPVELDGTVFHGVPARLEAEVRPGAADVVALPGPGSKGR